jgi:predicted nucleic acid-binding protein
VPAKKLIDLPKGSTVFIDTNIFLHHAFDINRASIEFLKRVEKGVVKAHTSALVVEELLFKLLMQRASNFLERVSVEKVKTLLKDEVKREKIFESIVQYLQYMDTLKKLGLKILEIGDKDSNMAIHLAKQWGMITADAFHLAVMQRKGIVHLVSDDSDYENVEDITLWRPS